VTDPHHYTSGGRQAPPTLYVKIVILFHAACVASTLWYGIQVVKDVGPVTEVFWAVIYLGGWFDVWIYEVLLRSSKILMSHRSRLSASTVGRKFAKTTRCGGA